MSVPPSILVLSVDPLSHSSGEFHTFRLPVPDLWLDIFQKMVAAGLNGVRCASRSKPERDKQSLMKECTAYTSIVGPNLRRNLAAC